MNTIFNNFLSFFNNVDSKLLIAGALMILISILIIYITTIIVFSLKKRLEFSKIRLPMIDGVGEDSITKPQFKSVMPLEVELIINEDNTLLSTNKNNDDSFLSALSMEAGIYMLHKQINMPDIE